MPVYNWSVANLMITDLVDLPGADLVAQGIEDLRRGQETVEAALVSIGSVRLQRIGLDVPQALDEPEERLYRLLEEGGADTAHRRYNALVRRLVSFERAAACASR